MPISTSERSLSRSLIKPHGLTYASDLNGHYLVGVQIANDSDKVAWLCKPDYEVLTQVYGAFEWLMLRKGKEARPYVGFYTPKRSRHLLTVARAIVGEHTAKQIRYVDGDCLNLRRNNLAFVPVLSADKKPVAA